MFLPWCMPPLLFKSGLAVIAPLSGRAVKSTVGESFSLVKIHSREKSKFSSYNHEFFRVPGAGGELI
jgi:hypothetical protein